MSQNYNCVAPEPFNFSNPGDWPKWIRRFERFRQASGLINNPENEQVNMLVYCMGDNADDILLSCKIASDQLENYNKVIECFESHFIPRRNIIYERARFDQRCQQEGEKVNEFITALHSLAEHCNFGMLHDELIRDRIVVGVRDRALSERMQLDTDLTLVKATLMAKQLESVKEQQSSLYQQDSIDQIKKMPNHIKETKRHEPKIRQFKSNQLGGSSHGCTRCGNSNNHDWKNCPAMNSYCSKCKKKGHYAKVCRSEAINEIKSEIAFLGSVEDNSKKWIVPIKVNNRQINFKIDTGADVNVLPLQNYYQSFQRIKLEKSDKILQGPNGIPLETVGMIHVKLQNKGQQLNSKIYIVDKLKQPLLSGETSEKLNIVRMIQQLSSGGRGGQRGRLGSGDNRGCYNCGEVGHRKFECTKPARGGGRGRGQSRDGGSNNTCYNCGEVGHPKYECTNNTAEDGGQEENQRKSKKACYTCGEFGHKKDDCPKSETQESGDEEESSDNEEEETPQKRKQAEDSEEEEDDAPGKRQEQRNEETPTSTSTWLSRRCKDDQEQETEEDCPTPTASSTRDGRMQRDNQDQDPEKSLPSMPAVHTRYGRAVKIPRRKHEKKIDHWKKKYHFPEDNHCIVNLSEYELNPSEISLLNKGLSYRPIKNVFLPQIISSIESGIHNISNNNVHMIRNFVASTLAPTPSSRTSQHNKESHRRINKEISILNNLSKNKNITISRADKGGSVVILNTEDYINRMKTHLNNTEFFVKIEPQEASKSITAFKKSIHQLLKNQIIDQSLKKQILENPENPGTHPYIYGLPKIHKKNTPLRPIVAYNQSPAYSLSKHLANRLSEITKNLPHIVKNPEEILQKMKNFKLKTNHRIVSYDVKDLYTSLPHDLIMDSLQTILIKHKEAYPDHLAILKLTEICLKSTTVKFTEEYYNQIKGTPMGSPLSTILAEIVLSTIDSWITEIKPNEILI
ncbi:hypothetical protein LAZ67_1002292 [Cordylochernes scorpioides]|uniref:CCHC-type domain-containing protein n=1 Tax=Cordylochernes scorpioides TaxID=51811 RepID=A0ABY6JW66_9ARAC|nr:hypothetical protein LAZ67_1002292 [Cordylochernes scorpioides]